MGWNLTSVTSNSEASSVPSNKFANIHTPQKMKSSIQDIFSECDQIRKKLWVWSDLLKESLIENFVICAVSVKIRCITRVWNDS